MTPGRMPMLVRPTTPEELADADAAERRRQREARIDALAVDRRRFDHPLLEQASKQIADGFADEERVIARRRARTLTTKTEALRKLTAPASLWRRVIWGER